MQVKSRFCPSPTGYIHLGNARTALFNALIAYQKKDGCFLLRIEDTDRVRSKEIYTRALQEDLEWLGCDWQEGPSKEREHAPYYQAQRTDIYEHYYQQLIHQDLAYPCFCHEEKLEETRRIQRKLGQAPRYDGTCRRLSATQVAEKVAQGFPAALRFSVAEDQVIEFEDLVRGPQKILSRDIGDFIIKKSDGSASFMFCNALDDALMGVNLALRGEDHLTNTPRQILILRALGLTPPQYGHLSLILGQDGRPLSKRNGSHSLQELRQAGFLPLAIINYLVRLGHVYTDHAAFLSLADCAQYFNLEHLVKAAAHYDEQTLLYWQKEAVARLTIADLLAWADQESLLIVPTEKMEDFLRLIQPNSLFPSDVKKWAHVFFDTTTPPVFSVEQATVLQQAGKVFFQTALESMQTAITYPALCQALTEKLGVKGKALFMPLRLALTHAAYGPELTGVFSVLGPVRVHEKFRSCQQFLR